MGRRTPSAGPRAEPVRTRRHGLAAWLVPGWLVQWKLPERRWLSLPATGL